MDPTVLLAQAGPSVAFLALLIWFGRLYFTGRLIPKSEVDRLERNFQQQIERERQITDIWHEVATNNNESLGKLTGQTDRLLESQKTVETFILSLPRSDINELPPGPRRLSQGPGGRWQ